ncbi:hypothetical protein C2E31_09920 [Rhodopirellula baltica]|nr:hypothetical protein C2E31_09920 [Rhodopirellula baltica]
MLTDDLRAWFDDEIWRSADDGGGQRFLLAIEPEALLAPAPHAVWPALMPCDFLPLISNGIGDHLCVRLGQNNRPTEIVQWFHGGGDWIPWGSSLSEAIYFDSVRQQLPGGQREHAFAALEDDSPPRDSHAVDDWAIGRLNGRVNQLTPNNAPEQLAEHLLQCKLSEVAVRCQLCIAAIDNPALQELSHSKWKSVPAVEKQQYLFDCRLVPQSLALNIGLQSDTACAAQDWAKVAEHCQAIDTRRHDLAWVYDLWGYSFERSDNRERAIACYRKGLQCSVFTDQTVRVRTHAFINEGQKFSASRLQQLGYRSADPSEQEYLDCLAANDAADRRQMVFDHFANRAQNAAPNDTYQALMKAGWDLGAEPMPAYGELLSQIANAAESAGMAAVATLASTHRDCFKERYGI